MAATTRLSDVLEELESRRQLSVTYLGVTHTNTPSTDERYTYEVSLTAAGTGELWMRYNAQFDRIDFDDNSSFSNTTNTVSIQPVGRPGVAEAAPFSAPGIETVNRDWNTPGVFENFHSARINVVGEAGTRVFLANGDPLPLSLSISLGVSPSTPSTIDLNGPIDTSSNSWASYAISLNANTITTAATVTHGSGVGLRARDGVEVRNTINGSVTSYVSDGDFHLIAGGVINGGTGIYIGQEGGGVGFGGVGGDILIDGTINGGSVTLQTNSTSQATNILTGPSGLLSGGGSLTLFNAGLDGGRIDVTSRNYSVTNVNVGTPTNTNPDIGISVKQTSGNLSIAAVPSSRGQISLSATAADAQILVKSDINTQAGLTLDASKLVVSSPLSTSKGNVVLTGDTVSIGSNVFAGTGGIGNVQVTSRTGDVTVSSAAVVSAPNGIISVDSKNNIASQARLVAPTLALVAGGSMTLNSNADEVRATAGTGITISDSDSLVVRSAQTTSGPIALTAGAALEVVNAAIAGTGSATLSGVAGVAIRDLRVKNGSATAVSSLGNVRVTGTVTVEGADNDLSLAADTGNVIIDATANVSVADKIDLAAPKGRVLTPGAIKSVTVDTSGAGYTSSPTVTLDAGSGGAATPAVAFQQLSGIRVLSGGSGYVTAPTVNIIGGGGSNAQATAFVSGGTVTKILVTNPGSGYTSMPTITFSGGSGSGATAEAMVGGVSSISVTSPGSGYLIPPEVVISAGAGAQSGAVTVNSTGGITGINLAYGGSDFGVPPTVEIFDSSGAGSGATATASLSSGVGTYLITSGGSGYTAAPTVTISGGGGTGATATSLISGSVTNVALGAPGAGYSPGVVVSVIGNGSGAAAAATISGSVVGTNISTTNSSGSGYDAVPTVTVTGGGGAGATATALLGLTASSFTLDAVPVNQTARTYSNAPNVTFSAPAGGGVRATGQALLGTNGTVTGVRITNAGSGYLPSDTLTATLSGGTVTGGTWTQTFTGDNSNFTVSGVTITAPGTGYTGNAALTFTGGSPGSAASGTAFVLGSIASVFMTNFGSGYTSAPTVVFNDATGTGATATAELSAQVIGLQILTPGSGYTSAPTVTIAAPTAGTTATATVGLTSIVSGITVTNAGKGYDPASTTVRLTPVAGGGGAVTGAITVDAAGTISSINLSTRGTDYVTPPQVIINDASGSGSGATATAIVDSNPASPTYRQVTGITVAGGGTGYNPETTTVTLKSAGSGATAIANLNASGGLASITVTNSGTGYQSGSGAPIVRLVPYGRTATGTATIAQNAVTGITVDNGGSGYTIAPTVTITGGGGTGATASASVVAGVVTAITVTNQGSGYTAPVTVTISGGGGSGAVATALVGGVSTPTVAIDNNADYFNYAALPTVTFSGGGSPTAPATGTAVITDVATINATRMSWTALESPLAAVTTQFRRLSVNLTGIGASLALVSSSPLTLEGATTKDGSISVSAPSLTITNPVTVGDYSSTRDKTISLAASSGDLIVDAAIGSLLPGAQVRTPLAQSITLTALQGGIGATATPGLLTTDKVVFTASKSTTLRTSTRTISGSVSDSTANISVSQRDVDPTTGSVLPLEAALVTANGGNVSFDVDAQLAIGQITAGTGTITLAASTLVENTVDAAADLVGSSASLVARTGKIDLQTTVASLSAQAPQSTITISNVPSAGVSTAPAIDLVKIAGRNDVKIQSQSTITATDVSSSTGTVALTATGTGSDVLLKNVGSPQGVVTIVAERNVGVVDPAATAAVITTSAARVTATTGAVALRTDVDTLAIDAAGAIDVSEQSAVSLGEPTGPAQYQFVRSASGNVSVTAGGAISAFNVQAPANAIRLESTAAGVSLGTVTTGALSVFSKGDVSDKGLGGGVIDADTVTVTGSGNPIDLLNQSNRIGTFSATNGSGLIAVKDTTGGLVLGDITGGTVSIVSTGTGPVNQSGAMNAVNLTVNGVGNAITLANAGNKIGVFASSNAGGDVYVRDTDAGLAIAGITGAKVTVVAAGAVTQALPITATSLEVHGSGTAAITLDKDNAVGSFKSGNGTANVYFKNTTGFDVTGINGGSVILLAAGAVTQSAAINATSLEVHNSAAGAVTLNQNNNLGSVKVGNGTSNVYVKDVSGDLDIAGINGGSVIVVAAGAVTQSAVINAAALEVHSTTGTGAITLNLNNTATSFKSGNGSGNIFFRDTTGDLDITGINGGHVTIIAAGAVTQSAVINSGLLEVHGNGTGAIALGLDNNITGFKSGNGSAAITLLDKTGGLDIAGVNGGTVTITSAGAGGITQSAAIGAASLTVSANGPSLTLDQNNSVIALAAATNPGGNVTFVNGGSFTTGPVQAGPLTATTGDGNILLKSVNGSITVTGDLTAKNDRVTLDARNGTFTLTPVPGVVIDANMLVYYVATTPTPDPATAPAGTYPAIIASNGDLTINSGTAVSFGDYTTDGNITITGSSVTIDGLLQTTGLGKTVTITATAGNIAFIGTGAIDNAAVLGGTTTLSAAAGTVTSQPTTAVSGGTTSFTVGQALSFAGPLSASSLAVTGAGGAISLTGSNVLDTVAVSNGSGNVAIKDTAGGLVLQALTGAAVTVEAAGAVTQTGVITATSLAVTGTGAAITLDAANKLGSFAATNGAGNVYVRDTDGGLSLGGITGGAVTVVAAGAVSQTAAVTATSLAVHGNGTGGIVLGANNAVGSFQSGNGAGSISFKDTTGDLVLAGLNGGKIAIVAAGSVTQSAAINGSSLTVQGGGNVTLTAANAVDSLGVSAPGNVAFTDAAGGLDLAGLAGNAVTLSVAGAVTQSAAVKVGQLSITGVGQPITLTNAGNLLSAFNATNGTGAVSLTSASTDTLLLGSVASGPLTVSSAGNVLVNQVRVTGNATISTAAGKQLAVSQQAGGILSSTGQLDLRGVQGPVTLINGGTLSGNPILVNSGYTVNVGGIITTTAQLNQAFATVATLPTIVGSTYEIVVGASLVLNQTLAINKPITLRGTSPAVTLNGSATATTGVVVGTAGSGSRITSLAFSGFSGIGIQLNAAKNVLVDGVSVNYAGTGLAISGASNGTRILGNAFANCPIGINIRAATYATIGGTLAGQRNTISRSARAGVFASGICTGSTVIKTAFANTPAPYNVGSSRGLRIVR